MTEIVVTPLTDPKGNVIGEARVLASIIECEVQNDSVMEVIREALIRGQAAGIAVRLITEPAKPKNEEDGNVTKHP